MASAARTRGGAGTKGMPRADREEQMLDAAAEEFGRRGWAHASMTDVARRAGISKPLLYDYFGSKDGLYIACVNRAGRRLVADVAAVQQGTSMKRALDTLTAIFTSLEGRRTDWAVIHDPTLPDGSAVQKAARTYRRKLFALASDGAAEVLADNGVTDVADQALFAQVWSDAVITIVRWWMTQPGESAEAMTQRCLRLVAAFSR